MLGINNRIDESN